MENIKRTPTEKGTKKTNGYYSGFSSMHLLFWFTWTKRGHRLTGGTFCVVYLLVRWKGFFCAKLSSGNAYLWIKNVQRGQFCFNVLYYSFYYNEIFILFPFYLLIIFIIKSSYFSVWFQQYLFQVWSANKVVYMWLDSCTFAPSPVLHCGMLRRDVTRGRRIWPTYSRKKWASSRIFGQL